MAQKLDKFYTKSDIAKHLTDKMCEVLNIDKNNSLFLEPSAGDGAFLSYLPQYIAYDIKPDNINIKQADFLALEPTWSKNVYSIGNPPFGKRSATAIQFLNKCIQTTKAVGFILPNTFKKWSVIKQIIPEAKLIYEETLDPNSFLSDGEDYSIRCIFQIWSTDSDYKDYTNYRLLKSPPIKHQDFNIWQYNGTKEAKKYVYENWQIAVYRQGYKDYTKKFFREQDYEEVKDAVENSTIQFFFIEPLTEQAKDIILNKIDFEELASRNLATPGFGKADFVSAYTDILKATEI